LRYRRIAEAEWISGETQNISGTGILFAADCELTVGTQIELQLALEAWWPAMARADSCPDLDRPAVACHLAATVVAARFVDLQLLPRRLGQA
jgi:hypothetical protein